MSPVQRALPFFQFDPFVDQKIFGMVVGGFNAAQFVIIVQDTVEHAGLFQRREILIQLDPDVAADLLNVLPDLHRLHLGIVVAGNQQGAFQQIGRIFFPYVECFFEVAEMQLVDDLLDALLDMQIGRVFPKMLKVGNDAHADGKNPVADRRVHIFIGVIDQVEQGIDFLVFSHGAFWVSISQIPGTSTEEYFPQGVTRCSATRF